MVEEKNGVAAHAGDSAGGLTPSWLHWPREAASRVREPYIPGALSILQGTVPGRVRDPVIWCPPTFVGNSGIERSNGHRGFALFCLSSCFLSSVRPFPSSYPAKAGYPVRRGSAVLSQASLGYWITRFRG